MAKWQSRAQIEQERQEQLQRDVVAALKPGVATLVAGWEASGYPATHAECEHAIIALLRETTLYKASTVPAATMNMKAAALNYFMKDIGAVLRRRQAEQEKAAKDAFKAAAQSRPVVEEGMYRKGFNAGEFARFPAQNRVLVCLSSEFIRAPQDIGQDDDGYACTFAEATAEEQVTEVYQRALKTMQDDLAYEARKKAELAERRDAELAAIRASGREPDYMDEFFAGTGDN